MGEENMNLNDYQQKCMRTLSVSSDYDAVLNGILGMCGESGEVADEMKKILFQNHEFNKDKLVEEIGDVLWYVATTLYGLGISLEECAERNIKKLEERYPDGFDSNLSKKRYIN